MSNGALSSLGNPSSAVVCTGDSLSCSPHMTSLPNTTVFGVSQDLGLTVFSLPRENKDPGNERELYNENGATEARESCPPEFSFHRTCDSLDTSAVPLIFQNLDFGGPTNDESVCCINHEEVANKNTASFGLSQKNVSSLPLLSNAHKQFLTHEKNPYMSWEDKEDNVQWFPFYSNVNSLKISSPQSTPSNFLCLPQYNLACDPCETEMFHANNLSTQPGRLWSPNSQSDVTSYNLEPYSPTYALTLQKHLSPDVTAEAISPLQHLMAFPKKRRGRPKGSRNKAIHINCSAGNLAMHSVNFEGLSNVHEVKRPVKKKKNIEESENFLRDMDFNYVTKDSLDAEGLSLLDNEAASKSYGSPHPTVSALQTANMFTVSNPPLNSTESFVSDTQKNNDPKSSDILERPLIDSVDLISLSMNLSNILPSMLMYPYPNSAQAQQSDSSAPIFSRLLPCVLCGKRAKTHESAYVCRRSSCNRSFCFACLSWERAKPAMKLFDSELMECVVCTYQSRKRATVDPDNWHFEFKDLSDGYFIRTLRDILPQADGLFIEISRTRQPCWRRKLSNKARKHFSFRFYGGVFESRLEALEIRRHSNNSLPALNSNSRRGLSLNSPSNESVCPALLSQPNQVILPKFSWSNSGVKTSFSSHDLNGNLTNVSSQEDNTYKKSDCIEPLSLPCLKPSQTRDFFSTHAPYDSSKTFVDDSKDNKEGNLGLRFVPGNNFQEILYASPYTKTLNQYYPQKKGNESIKSNDPINYATHDLGYHQKQIFFRPKIDENETAECSQYTENTERVSLQPSSNLHDLDSLGYNLV